MRIRLVVLAVLMTVLTASGNAATQPATKPAASALEPLTVYENAPFTSKLDDLPLKPSVSQYGITWTFEKPARVGHFINGDWYVVGPATIATIDPSPLYGKDVPQDEVDSKDGDSKAPVERRTRNGSVLNIGSGHDTAWDSGQKGYFNIKLAAHLPIAMKPGDCLASSISYKVADISMSNGKEVNTRTFHDNCPARVAAVLTCVAEPLPADAFRPGYADRKQTIYFAHNLHRDLLPTLPPIDRAPKPLVLAQQFQKPWLNVGMFGFEEPMENMPHYGQQIAETAGEAGLLMCTTIDPEAKERLMVNFVQVGIDYWALVRGGHEGWPCWGGHGSGRKFTIVLSGVLLGDDDMANVSSRFPKTQFGEDEQTAYGDCWTGATVVFTGHSGIDEATGIGRDAARGPNPWGPYENLQPSQWTAENYRSEAYRRANTSRAWIAEALVLRLMHLEPQWHHDAFFDYVDRWMTEDDKPARSELFKYAPPQYQRAYTDDPHQDYGWENGASERWLTPIWIKYRPMNPAVQNGWKQQHDDIYYRNAIAMEKKSK